MQTRHVRCPKCRITYEVQMAGEDAKARCEFCGATAQVDKPKRHDNPAPHPDDTPHYDKNTIGGY